MKFQTFVAKKLKQIIINKMKNEIRNERIFHVIDAMIESVENGTQSGLKTMIELKKLSEKLSGSIDRIKETAMDELKSFGNGSHSVNGAVVSIANVGGRWKYDHIDEWCETSNKLKNIETKLKSAYKAHENGLMSVDGDSGEIPELPIFSGSTETIKIQIPKTKK